MHSSYGHAIKSLREQQGLTQEALAKDICDRSTLSKIENGSSTPHASTLAKLCTRLNISISNLELYQNEDHYLYTLSFTNDVRRAAANRAYTDIERLIETHATAPSFQEPHMIAFLRWLQALVHHHVYNQTDEAFHVLQEALDTLKQSTHIDRIKMKADMLMSKGNFFFNLKQFDQAASAYHQAKEQLKNSHFLHAYDTLIRLYFNVSVLLIKQGQYQDALEHCQAGIRMCIETNTMQSLGELYYHAGLCEYHLGIETYQTNIDYALTLFRIKGHDQFHSFVEEKMNKLK